MLLLDQQHRPGEGDDRLPLTNVCVPLGQLLHSGTGMHAVVQ